jgi:hypothetical protein
MASDSNVAWQELGVVSDDETGVAARVFVGTRGRVPVPMVQLGRLGPGGKDFFPSIVPEVQWAAGAGTIPDLGKSASLPDSLTKQVYDMLKPHLVLPNEADLSEDDFKLIEIDAPAKMNAGLFCGLRCS